MNYLSRWINYIEKDLYIILIDFVQTLVYLTFFTTELCVKKNVLIYILKNLIRFDLNLKSQYIIN